MFGAMNLNTLRVASVQMECAAGDKAGAAAAYRESLKLQPGRRLSLAGLAKATS